MSARFETKIVDGKLSPIEKAIFRKYFGELEDGKYIVSFERKKTNSTRYRYWFDCVLAFALPAAQKVFVIKEKGVERPPRNTAELHEIVKGIFNPVVIIDTDTGEQIVSAGSTTGMSDQEFIGEFTEKVTAYFSSEPFFVEFPTYQEWGQLRSEGIWEQVKLTATAEL